MRTILAIAALVVLAFSSHPAAAQNQTVNRLTAQQFAQILTQGGFKSEVVASGNDRLVRVALPKSKYNANVVFYNCIALGCTSYRIVAWDTTKTLNTAFANAWNAQWLFTKAYIDDEGDFAFTYDIDMSGGISQNAIKQSAGLFDALLIELAQFNPK
jgi:hypothetical protein